MRRPFSRSSICWIRKPRALSGGQRQRVAMGRAIRNCFCSTNPLSNLDALLRLKNARRNQEVAPQRIGATTIYVTHDRRGHDARAAYRGAFAGGNIMQVGTRMKSTNRPRSKFVADSPVATDEFWGDD